MSFNNEEFNPGCENELTTTIGELALSLLRKHAQELICELPEKKIKPSTNEISDYVIEGNSIRFLSIEARNRNIINYLFSKYQDEFEGDTRRWLTTAHDLWRYEIGESESAAGRLLALVHKTNDIFIIAAKAIEDNFMGVLEVLHVVEASLPFLNNFEPSGIFKLCVALYRKKRSAGRFFRKLENVLEKRPALCYSIHAQLRANIAKTTSILYPIAIQAIAKTSPEEGIRLAKEDAASTNDILKQSALRTIGNLFALSQVIESEVPAISSLVISNMSSPVEKIRLTAIHAAAQGIPATSEFYDPLWKLGSAADQDALSAISNMLMVNVQNMKTNPNLKTWVSLLSKLSPHNKRAIDNYDYVLAQLIINNETQQQLVISCLTEWTLNNAKENPQDTTVAEFFGSTVSELSKSHELLSQIITDWFLSDSRLLASSAAGLLSHLLVRGIKEPEFSISRLDTLRESDLLFLVRRMLGFVSSEDHLFSLTTSLLKTKNAHQRTFGIVHSLLADEIGQDYPDTTIEKLEAAIKMAPDDRCASLYSKVINKINDRMKAIEDLPRLLELKPLPSIQRKFAMAQAKQMNRLMEKAQNNSIISQFATEIPIKAGQSWFNFQQGNYTKPSQMHSFSQTVTLPRRYVLDTVGYDIKRFLMRLVQRDKV